ncbi:MAG: hypothetical protein DBY09_06695 [Selenomonadales bacterium]|nr:MAG: hypothetical protein DBY09_06695 [Selenomonadales bacterium]
MRILKNVPRIFACSSGNAPGRGREDIYMPDGPKGQGHGRKRNRGRLYKRKNMQTACLRMDMSCAHIEGGAPTL